jgi:hypothetical protein
MWIVEEVIDDKDLEEVYFWGDRSEVQVEGSENVEGGGDGRAEKAKGF